MRQLALENISNPYTLRFILNAIDNGYFDFCNYNGIIAFGIICTRNSTRQAGNQDE